MWNRKTLLVIFIFCLCYAYSLSLGIRTKEFSGYVFENSDDWNSGIPFNFFLIDKDDNSIISFFVNEYIVQGNYLYFTEIKGELKENFCYKDNNLFLSKINLTNRELHRFIDINTNLNIYNKINVISNNDKLWLETKGLECD